MDTFSRDLPDLCEVAKQGAIVRLTWARTAQMNLLRGCINRLSKSGTRQTCQHRPPSEQGYLAESRCAFLRSLIVEFKAGLVKAQHGGKVTVSNRWPEPVHVYWYIREHDRETKESEQKTRGLVCVVYTLGQKRCNGTTTCDWRAVMQKRAVSGHCAMRREMGLEGIVRMRDL